MYTPNVSMSIDALKCVYTKGKYRKLGCAFRSLVVMKLCLQQKTVFSILITLNLLLVNIVKIWNR